ncbi:MAG: hypothetical protein J0I96_15690 [Rhodanobacter sp.]|nr:hypothetical protein [Rhodanobacter sp.]
MQHEPGENEMTLDQQDDRAPAQVMGIDAGGTMTDTFFVRSDGRFVVGKAQSNPQDESLAIYNSSQDALALWGRDVDQVYPELVTCVYSGTAMLNRVVQRKGLDVGLIVNKGLPIWQSLLVNMSPGLMPGLFSQSFSIMYLIAAPIVPTWMMMPVEVRMQSPTALYSVKHSSPSCSTIGLAAIFLAVSRAWTRPPRIFENSFS